MNDKPKCMNMARKFEREYWDGPRKYGYGGYKYIKDLLKPMARLSKRTSFMRKHD